MPKRGENIRKRNDGRWEGRFIEYNAINGENKLKSIYGKSYAEVKSKLRTKAENTDITTLQELPYKSIEEVCQEWLNKAKIKLKQSSYARYYMLTTNHVIPYFKSADITALTEQNINMFIEAKLYNGRLDGKGSLSTKTTHDISLIFMQILNYARKKQYIPDIKYEMELPKVHTSDYTILNESEQTQLEKYINDTIDNDTIDSEKVGVLIALYTGIRIGELCALKWSDIKFDVETLSITKTIQRIKNVGSNSDAKTKIIIDRPKSQKSIREIPLPHTLITTLKKLSKAHKTSDYILTGTDKYTEPRTYQGKFKRYLRGAGIKDINFHGLRHTFATRAIEVNFDIKSLSEILGHSTVKFTLERYVHSSQALKKEHMNKLAVCSY